MKGMRARLPVILISAILFSTIWASGAVPGPIRVSANHRYFVDRDGRPFLWLGDTAWPLLVFYPQAQAEAYLRNRAAKGFTVIQCVLAWEFAPGEIVGPEIPSTERQTLS